MNLYIDKRGYILERLKSTFRNFNGGYGDLIKQYEISLLRMWSNILQFDRLQLLPNFNTLIPSVTFT